MSSKKINKKTTIKEILEIEGAEEILEKYNLPCLSCPMASFEINSLQIGDVSKMYGLDGDSLIKELNKL
ncbi:MAG: hypothetical protein PHH17_00520 [Candidatus Pacebacteria bacterium]|jgi:hypothetical protein|nr:hypothetical protein [Candidatus Paceibacterota bacterium]MDD3072183.1 hypothetical protein [Candidatus Paceibacterota bacterium]MDD3728752.1 hypothetical protein [Candidatus Paceibacterota bacterium]MDD4201389.1 hypothetical protein [Candidatus Paceibacterota bacterium]MDD4466829.1 hypothetical protein [Candidatus Paceibacterota bacterium]